jgi:hypothetical protein
VVVTKNEPDDGEAETQRNTERCCRWWMIGMAWMERQGQHSEAGSGGAKGCERLWPRHGRQASIVGIPAPQIKPILAYN